MSKKTILTFGAMLIFGLASAQTETHKKQDAKTVPADTITVIETPAEMKKSETVKTQNHDKSTRKNKTAKDSIAVKPRKSP
ncbi:hypothetical protein [Flavobacterium sp.]|uniref:hypothetical protein n=1 Tax=Flavobacterium sp. TaxID=239 RepID=UPI0039E5963E